MPKVVSDLRVALLNLINIIQQTYHWSDKFDDRYSEIKFYQFHKPIHFLYFIFRFWNWYFPLTTLIVFRFFLHKIYFRTSAAIRRDKVFWKTSMDPLPFPLFQPKNERMGVGQSFIFYKNSLNCVCGCSIKNPLNCVCGCSIKNLKWFFYKTFGWSFIYL